MQGNGNTGEPPAELALGADMRFMAPDARMSIMEIKWGLVPDMSGTPILASLVRDDILRDLTFTPDGLLYTLSETTLTQFDSVSGLNGGTWKERRILSDLTGARALTWLVP